MMKSSLSCVAVAATVCLVPSFIVDGDLGKWNEDEGAADGGIRDGGETTANAAEEDPNSPPN